jgi:hypothetical protein
MKAGVEQVVQPKVSIIEIYPDSQKVLALEALPVNFPLTADQYRDVMESRRELCSADIQAACIATADDELRTMETGVTGLFARGSNARMRHTCRISNQMNTQGRFGLS